MSSYDVGLVTAFARATIDLALSDADTFEDAAERVLRARQRLLQRLSKRNRNGQDGDPF